MTRMAARAKVGDSAQRAADGVWLRSRDAAVGSEGDDRFGRLLSEAGWIVGAVAAVALFAILVTFSSHDRRSPTPPAGRVRNIGGRWGAWGADIGVWLCGLSAYLLVFGLAITVVRGFRKLHRVRAGDPLNDDLPAYAHGIGFVLMLFGAVGLETLRFHTLALPLPGSPGGVVGSSVAQLVQASVGSPARQCSCWSRSQSGCPLFLDFRGGGGQRGVAAFSKVSLHRARHKRDGRRRIERSAKLPPGCARRRLAMSASRIDEATPVHTSARRAVKPSERKQKEKSTAIRGDGRRRLPPRDLLDEPP